MKVILGDFPKLGKIPLAVPVHADGRLETGDFEKRANLAFNNLQS